MKIYITLICIFIIGAISYATTSISEENKAKEPKYIQDLKKNPTVSNPQQEAFKKHIEEVSKKLFTETKEVDLSKDPSIQLTPEKRKELEGPINKEYGIREDILRFIDKEIPADNEIARREAIRLMADTQRIYYGGNLDEAVPLMNKTFISTRCLLNTLPDWEGHLFYKKLTGLMEDTQERKKYISNFDRKVFAWKIIGYGNNSSEDLDNACKTGKY